MVHAAGIALTYPLAYLVSRAISSERRLFSAFHARPIYLLTFCLLIAILPAGAFVDFVSDILVVSLASDILAGATKTVALSLACSVPFAIILTIERWSVPPRRQQ